MSRTVRDADLKKYERDQPERVDDGSPAGMSPDRENSMDEIFSDPLLEMIDGLDAGDSQKCIAEYLTKYRLLGVVECSNCGRLNYEGDEPVRGVEQAFGGK